MNAMWFRADLRVHDNPALYHAVQSGPIVAIYALCEKQWDIHQLSNNKREFIIAQLKQLNADLAKLGIPLLIIKGADFKSLPAKLLGFCHKHCITNVFFNDEYELNERSLTLEVENRAAIKNVALRKYHDQCLIEPGIILNKQGLPYRVFTAFKKEYISQFKTDLRPIYGSPKTHKEQKDITVKSDLTALDGLSYKAFDHEILSVGEEKSHEQLNDFCESGLSHYNQDRDFPSIEGTSYLSAYLAVGILSVRQCYQAAQTERESEGRQTWVSELIWRDFYRHLLFLFPDLSKHKAFQSHTDELPWKHDERLFKAWCEGKTGYPIVDAAMRQLNETGWMHNRLRMVVSMFLTKHLFIDWRKGEEYFMQHLIDADFASNNGGWQWSASTGVDAAPYFRIFNPTRQSERFDQNGDFIRQYLPKLASLDKKSIHSPSSEQAQLLGYALPIVDHKLAVAQTKANFKALTK